MGRTSVLIKRLPKFIGVNIIGTAVDTAVLWIFSHYIFKGYVGEYIISPIISFEWAYGKIGLKSTTERLLPKNI